MTKPTAATPASHSSKAAQILERALTQVEALLGNLDEPEARPVPIPDEATKEAQQMASVELNDIKRTLREVVVRLEDALDHLGIEAQRLSDETSRITIVADRLESRLLGLTRSLERGAPTEAERVPPPEAPAADVEPRFLPGERGIAIVIAAVPGFQGLMDVQRGLSGLHAVEGASVSRYRNGEASLELVLRTPVTARQLVDTLRLATGRGVVVEDEAPDELRLRLRFVDADSARGNGAVAEVAVEPLPQRVSPDG